MLRIQLILLLEELRIYLRNNTDVFCLRKKSVCLASNFHIRQKKIFFISEDNVCLCFIGMFTHPCTYLDTLQRVLRGLLSLNIMEDKPGTLKPLFTNKCTIVSGRNINKQ